MNSNSAVWNWISLFFANQHHHHFGYVVSIAHRSQITSVDSYINKTEARFASNKPRAIRHKEVSSSSCSFRISVMFEILRHSEIHTKKSIPNEPTWNGISFSFSTKIRTKTATKSKKSSHASTPISSRSCLFCGLLNDYLNICVSRETFFNAHICSTDTATTTSEPSVYSEPNEVCLWVQRYFGELFLSFNRPRYAVCKKCMKKSHFTLI